MVAKLQRVANQFTAKRQDQTLKLMIYDPKFLDRVVDFLRPEYFSSEILVNLAKGVCAFYDEYKTAPLLEQMDEVIDKLIEDRRISEDEVDSYVSYMHKLTYDVSTANITQQWLIDNLQRFAKAQITTMLERGLAHTKDLDTREKLVEQAYDELGKASAITKCTDILEVREPVTQDWVSCLNVDPIDKQMGGGFHRGLLYQMLGYLGTGKTWMMVHIGKMAVRFGKLVLHVACEDSNARISKRYKSALAACDMDEVSSNYKYIGELVSKAILCGSRIVLMHEDEKSKPIDVALITAVEDCVRRYYRKPDIILIDSADDLLPPRGQYKDDLERDERKYIWLKNYARTTNICIVTTVQATRRGEHALWLSSSLQSGYLAKSRKSQVGISVNALERESDRDYCRLFLFKNNEGRHGAKCWVKRDLDNGQYVTAFGGVNDDYWEHKIGIREEEDDRLPRGKRAKEERAS